MLYLLLSWIESNFQPPGFGAFEYISVRTMLATVSALIISLIFGNKIIDLLRKLQLGETIRDDIGLDSHLSKAGTPSMGGIIILIALLVPSFLWMKPDNVYGWLILSITLIIGLVGFLDDYIKIIRKDKKGLAGRFKIAGQVGCGLLLGSVLYFHPDFQAYNTLSTVPFFKNTNIDYSFFSAEYAWMIYIPVVVFVLTAVSNAVNLTDGLDGLASGTSAIAGVALGILVYVSGRVDFSGFLNILYLPGIGELTVFAGSLVGACIGFLWYNTHPAQVFMGDTGSLALGGALGALAIMAKKELMLPILCGVFFMETLSVILQTSYFKYTRKKYGEGRRIFLMAPLHHHFEKKGWAEPKIVVRFWIIALLLAMFTILTLKLR